MFEKVLFINETSSIGGAEINLLRITSALKTRGIDLSVLIPEKGKLVDRLQERNIKVMIIPGCPHYSVSFYVSKRYKLPNPFAIIINIIKGFFWSIKISKAIGSNSQTIVYTNSLLSHVFGGLAGLLTGNKIIWHFQDIVDVKSGLGLYHIILIFLANIMPDKIICISEQVAKQFRNNSKLDKKLVVLNNQIDPSEFESVARSKSFIIKRDSINIGTVARLTPWKGQSDALEVAKKLVQSGINFNWFFVGDTSLGSNQYFRSLMEFVKINELTENVHFLGWIDDMKEFYRSIDVLVHIPIEVEPFGLTLIEALACGIPVISTPGGANKYVTEAGGWIVQQHDINSILSIIKLLYFNPSELEAHSINAYNYINHNTNFNDYISTIIDCINIS